MREHNERRTAAGASEVGAQIVNSNPSSFVCWQEHNSREWSCTC